MQNEDNKDRRGAVTRLLQANETDEPRWAEELLPLIYEELRALARARMAREGVGHTIQATALVHDAYLLLVGDADPGWNGRQHFFGAAAEAMRRILVDQARKKQSQKRGGDRKRHRIGDVEIAAPEPSIDVLAVSEVLERFQRSDPVAADLVKLRYYAGLTIPQAAGALSISTSTADRYWSYARAWLHAELKKGDQSRAG